MSRTIHLSAAPQRSAPAPRAHRPPHDFHHDLAEELRQRISGEVRFDPGSRALYATDHSIYRQVPIGVVIPRTIDDVLATVDACHRFGAPLLSRGAGSSLSGQTCNVAVVIDFSKHVNRILNFDPDAATAEVQPGVICDQLRHTTEPRHLILPPDPATHQYCTLGGMVGNNSCGAHSVMGGRTSDNVEELDILTYDGLRMRVGKTSDEQFRQILAAGGRRAQIYQALHDLRDKYADLIRTRYPKIPRRVSGYNLDDLLPENGFHVARALTGSEGTCVTLLSAKLHLVHKPPHHALLVVGYPDAPSAGDAVPHIMPLKPMALEAFHTHVLRNMHLKDKHPEGEKLLPRGDCWLLVEFGGDSAKEATDRAHHAAELIRHDNTHLDMKVIEDEHQQKSLWHIREAGVGSSRIPNEEDAWPSWEDSAVPPEKVGDYLRDFERLVARFNYQYTLFGHFGQGCLHTRIAFGLHTAEGIARFRDFMQHASDLVLSYGGSLSGEHGDGQAKGELLPKMFGPELIDAFRQFKRIWDPDWKMNPGKVIDANPLDSHIRVGPENHPMPTLTYFRFPEDRDSFATATERCFGIGKCRRLESGGKHDDDTMCPSFMATREEMHSTRGRAHLLFEMMRGEVIQEGWDSPAVKESLDLCLACKGCKGDCPVSVDIATYKAEFLAHYYEHHRRPLAAFAMGLIDKWARLSAPIPGLANFFTQTPVISDLLKRAAGLATQRSIPPFARHTFRHWFNHRPVRNIGMAPVLLWPDTFNNYFHPQTAQAAVEVLEAAGRRVLIPDQILCCGRPLYDYGMLPRAIKYLRKILDALRPHIRNHVPMVGLEPSCVSVFRNELINLFPDDPDANALAGQTYTLAQFLNHHTDFHAPPLAGRKAFIHGHCHAKSITGIDNEEQLLKNLGLKLETIQCTCCGVAGSFGYEEDKYDLSMHIGELGLLPAIRNAPKDALIIADGFSCRSQIHHATDRRALHLAQVLKLALDQSRRPLTAEFPERAFTPPKPRVPSRKTVTATLMGAGFLAGVAAGWSLAAAVKNAKKDR
ncbi:MAG TPA: FAD-linked oxidase C-terminal domain-containing protein [Phycisphaerae bacterium]|nr:FAD-linked oxidase C-terminal domain-containing protein [Phycisphaerae bacterium]